jgi:hypothetical protein
MKYFIFFFLFSSYTHAADFCDGSSKSVAISKDVSDVSFEILKRVALKKIWIMSGEKVQTKAYLSNECESAYLNKWPFFKPQVYEGSSDKVRDEQYFSHLKNVCKPSLSFESLSPYVTKDVFNEAIAILEKIYPQDIKNVKGHACEQISKVSLTSLKDDKYNNYVMSEVEAKDLDDFAKWFKNILSYKVRYGTDKEQLTSKVRESFQNQGRKKSIYEILSKEEVQMIKEYSGENFQIYNPCLRKSNCDSDSKKSIDHIVSALNKIKMNSNKEVITLFRGIGQVPYFIMEAMLRSIKTGEPIILDKAFLSTSGIGTVARRFGTMEGVGGARLVIKSRSCVGVAEISLMQTEDEFICPPSMKFRVTKSGLEDTYHLEEID